MRTISEEPDCDHKSSLRLQDDMTWYCYDCGTRWEKCDVPLITLIGQV